MAEETSADLAFETRFGRPGITNETKAWLDSLEDAKLVLWLSHSNRYTTNRFFGDRLPSTLIVTASDFPALRLSLVEELSEIYLRESGIRKRLLFDLILSVSIGKDVGKLNNSELGGLTLNSKLISCFLETKAAKEATETSGG